jgi:hypothetical protein
LDKKTLKPKGVKVMDRDMNVVVDISFKSFDCNPSFAKKDFDEKQSMAMAKVEAPAMGDGKADFKIYYPTVTLPKTALSDMKPEETADGKAFVLKYEGENPFTLIETKSDVQTSDLPVMASGEPFNLGFTLGASTEHTLKWSQNGMDFFLASERLTKGEMQEIAESVNGKIIK